jgi:hypothetical protein
MKNYDFQKAAQIIEAERTSIESAELGMYNDWDWTSKEVFAGGAYTIDLDTVKEIAGIPGSTHDTPTLAVYYKDGTTRTFNCYEGQSDRASSPVAMLGGIFSPSGNSGLPTPADY